MTFNNNNKDIIKLQNKVRLRKDFRTKHLKGFFIYILPFHQNSFISEGKEIFNIKLHILQSTKKADTPKLDSELNNSNPY